MREKLLAPAEDTTVLTIRVETTTAEAVAARAAGLGLYRAGYIRRLIRADLEAATQGPTDVDTTVFD